MEGGCLMLLLAGRLLFEQIIPCLYEPLAEEHGNLRAHESFTLRVRGENESFASFDDRSALNKNIVRHDCLPSRWMGSSPNVFQQGNAFQHFNCIFPDTPTQQHRGFL